MEFEFENESSSYLPTFLSSEHTFHDYNEPMELTNHGQDSGNISAHENEYMLNEEEDQQFSIEGA